MAAIFVCYPHDNHLLYLENCAREVIYEVSFGTVFLTVNGQSGSHRFSMAYISKSIQDNHRVTIDDGYKVIYEVSFGAIVFDLE